MDRLKERDEWAVQNHKKVEAGFVQGDGLRVRVGGISERRVMYVEFYVKGMYIM